jgi:hypothetical protein
VRLERATIVSSAVSRITHLESRLKLLFCSLLWIFHPAQYLSCKVRKDLQAFMEAIEYNVEIDLSILMNQDVAQAAKALNL